MNLSLLDIKNIMLAQHNQKPFLLCKFSCKHVSVWCQQNYLHCTVSSRPRTALLKHFEANVCIFLLYLVKRIFVPEM